MEIIYSRLTLNWQKEVLQVKDVVTTWACMMNPHGCAQ